VFKPSSPYSFIQNARQWKWFKKSLPTLCSKYLHDFDVERFITYLLDSYEKYHSNRGIKSAIAHHKWLYDCSLRYAGNATLPPSDHWSKSDKDGLPNKVAPLRQFLTGGDTQVQIALLILSSFKDTGYTPSSVSTKPITEHRLSQEMKVGNIGSYFTKTSKLLERDSEIVEAWKDVLEEAFPARQRKARIRRLKKLSNSVHTSTKNGPNGPAVDCASVDYIALAHSPEAETLFLEIKKLAVLTRNKSLIRILNSFSKDEELNKTISQELISKKKLCTSRLAIKHGEKWGKERLFAIGDWFSQSSLSGMHEFMFQWLSKQPGDGTFCQNSVAEIVREWTGNKEIHGVYSSDLSSATDHIPVKLLFEIVLRMFGKNIALSWYRIMVRRHFYLTDGTNQSVSYSTGQPLGLLTSWAIMSIWHHLIYRMCFRLANKQYIVDSHPQYVVLGDDSSNLHADVTRWYQLIVGLHCDVGISPVKGFSPEQINVRVRKRSEAEVGTVKTAELAKRVFTEGMEITPSPPSLVIEGLESSTSFRELVLDLSRRSFTTKEQKLHLGINLLCLAKHKKAALLNAIFPLWPALDINTEVTDPTLENLVKELDIALTPEDYSIIYCDHHELKQRVKLYLNDRIQQQLTESFYHLQHNMLELTKGSRDICNKYQFSAISNRVLWSTVFNQYYKALGDAEQKLVTAFEDRTRDNLLGIIQYPDIVKLLARLSLIMRVDDLITKRKRLLKRPNRETSMLINQLTKEVNKPIPLMSLSASRIFFTDENNPLTESDTPESNSSVPTYVRNII
jgi:hypothetical protein